MSKNNIAKDSLALTIAQSMTLVVNMINAMLLSRHLTLGEYGTYSQTMTVSTIIVTFFAAGFAQCINYFLGISESEADKKRFVKNYYSIITFVGVVGGTLALLLLPLFQRYYDNPLLSQLWFVFLFYPLSHILTSGTDRFFIAYKKITHLLLFKVSHSVIVLLEILCAILLGLTFFQYMMIYTFVEVTFGASVYVWVRGITGTVPFGAQKDFVWQIFKFAIPMALASLVSTINTEMDKLVVGGMVDAESLAIYTNAAKELPIHIFSTSISSVVMPVVVRKVADKNCADAAKLWKKSTILSCYLIFFFVSALFVFAPQVISLLYSDKYLPGVTVFRIYTLVLLFRVTYYGMVLNALGDTKTILKASVATLISNLALDVLLFHLLGMAGPAVATLLSVAIMNIYQLILTKRRIQVKFTDMYPLREMTKIFLVNFAMGGVFYVLHWIGCRWIAVNDILLAIILGVLWLFAYYIIVRKKIMKLWRDLNE